MSKSNATKEFPIIRVIDYKGTARRLCYWWGGDTFNQQLYSRWLWEKWFGNIPEGYIIHHTDCNPLNDWIENYTILSIKDHSSFHFLKYYRENRDIHEWERFLKFHDQMDNSYKYKRKWMSINGISDSDKLKYVLYKYNIKPQKLSSLIEIDVVTLSKILSGNRNAGIKFLNAIINFINNPKANISYCRNCKGSFVREGLLQYCNKCRNLKHQESRKKYRNKKLFDKTIIN